jgi:electron transport complex protein RnfG
MIVRNMLIGSALLGLFAVIGVSLVTVTHVVTQPIIAENERQALLNNLHILVPSSTHSNAIETDIIQVTDESLGSSDVITVYRARMHGQPVAAIFTSISPDGYSGNIKLLIGINHNGSVAGVRVINHKETPGLGDAIEAERSNWILSFNGKTLNNPPLKKWAVKKDGGVFDAFTGATITPRAVVKAVKNTLLYYREHREMLFSATMSPEATNG